MLIINHFIAYCDDCGKELEIDNTLEALFGDNDGTIDKEKEYICDSCYGARIAQMRYRNPLVRD